MQPPPPRFARDTKRIESKDLISIRRISRCAVRACALRILTVLWNSLWCFIRRVNVLSALDARVAKRGCWMETERKMRRVNARKAPSPARRTRRDRRKSQLNSSIDPDRGVHAYRRVACGRAGYSFSPVVMKNIPESAKVLRVRSITGYFPNTFVFILTWTCTQIFTFHFFLFLSFSTLNRAIYE